MMVKMAMMMVKKMMMMVNLLRVVVMVSYLQSADLYCHHFHGCIMPPVQHSMVLYTHAFNTTRWLGELGTLCHHMIIVA